MRRRGGVSAATESSEADVTRLDIVAPGTVLTAGETYRLLWNFTPAGAPHEEITWTYSKEGVVSVASDGKLTALGEGSCTVTGATASGLTDSVEVRVKWPDNPKLVLDSPESVVMEEGDTYQIKWHFVPDSGTPPVVTWESATPEYLTVDENGLLTAKTRLLTSVTGTYGPEDKRQTVKVNVEITPPEWELVGFDSQAILTGNTLEFRYPNREVTNQKGERVKPGKFIIYDYLGSMEAYNAYCAGSPIEITFPTDKKEQGGSTITTVTFDKPGGYKVMYSGDGWDKECFIFVADSLLPDSLDLETGETAVLLDRSSWSRMQRIGVFIQSESYSGAETAIYDNWVQGNADPLTMDICRISGKTPGKMTVYLYDEWFDWLDTCEVTVTGEDLEVPMVWASLNSVSQDSALIDVRARGRCNLIADVYGGDVEADDSSILDGRYRKSEIIYNYTEGPITVDELMPGRTYTVFVYGTIAGISSPNTRITFTTPNPPTVEASLGTINETSAVVNITADKTCTLIAGLYPGGSELPATGADIQAKALQYKTVSEAANGSVTYDKLQSATSYSVFVSGVDKDGNYSPVKRVDFTTKKLRNNSGSGSSSNSGSGGNSGGDHSAVAVTDITGIPTQILVGQTVTLNPVVQPSNATRKSITWSIADGFTGNLKLNGSSLTGIAASESGKPAVLRATIAKGGKSEADYIKDFPIRVLAPVTLTTPEGLTTGKDNPLPPAKKNAGEAYTQEFTATGGMGGPYTFELKDSTLPAGWNLKPVQGGQSDTAKLSGMPGAIGTHRFTIRVKDKAGNSTDYKFTLEVTESGFLPVTGITGVPTQILVGQTLELKPAVQPTNASIKTITWSIVDGSTAYLTLNGSSLTGASTSEPGKPAMLRATIAKGGANETNYTKDFPIQVLAPVTLTEPSGLDPKRANTLPSVRKSTTVKYEQEFTAAGGTGGPYTFELKDSNLPEDWKLEAVQGGSSNTAVLSGMPAQKGTYQFTVRVKDKNRNSTDYAFTLEISEDVFVPVTGITGIPEYVIGGTTVTLEGKVTPGNATNKNITWEIREQHPMYYSLSGDDLTTDLGGSGNFVKLRARIQNGLGNGDYTEDFDIEMVYPVALEMPPENRTVQIGETVNLEFKAVNGKPEGNHYNFEVLTGRLPEGLVLEEGVSGDYTKATLKGAPQETGRFQITIKVTDHDGNYADYTFTITVTALDPVRNLLSLPAQTGKPGIDDIILDEDAEIASSSNATPEKQPSNDDVIIDEDAEKASPSDATPASLCS